MELNSSFSLSSRGILVKPFIILVAVFWTASKFSITFLSGRAEVECSWVKTSLIQILPIWNLLIIQKRLCIANSLDCVSSRQNRSRRRRRNCGKYSDSLGAVFFSQVCKCTFPSSHMEAKCYLDTDASSLKTPTKLQSKGRLNCCPL